MNGRAGGCGENRDELMNDFLLYEAGFSMKEIVN